MKNVDTKAHLARLKCVNAGERLSAEFELSADAVIDGGVLPQLAVLVSYSDITVHLAMSPKREDKRWLGGALRSMMNVMGHGQDHPATSLAPGNLSASLEAYYRHPNITVLCTATKNNRRSALRALSDVYTELQNAKVRQDNPLYNPFWAEAMLAAAEAKLTPAFRTDLKKRCNEGYMPRSLETLSNFAARLGVPVDRLKKHCWFWEPTQLFDLRNPSYNWVEDHHLLTRVPYALSELPTQVEETLAPFFRWRRVGTRPRLTVTHLDGSSYDLIRKGGWTLTEGQSIGEAPAAEVLYREFLRSFFGFMSLPSDASDPQQRGRGLPIEKLEVAHLFVGSNITAYCDFIKLRNGRFDHTGLQKLRQDWCTLIGSLKSYGRHAQVELLPSMTAVLGEKAVPKTPGEWSTWCSKQLVEIDDWILEETQGRSGSAKFQKARSVRESLAFLLRKERPMEEVVWPTVFWLKNNRPPSYYHIRDRFIHEARIFMVAALASEPLRQKTWKSVLWGKHIYKRDGKWEIWIPRKMFKNRRVLTEDYHGIIEDTAQEFFEAFYQAWKENFGIDPLDQKNEKKCCFVMAAWGRSPHERPCETMLTTRLNFLKTAWNVTINPHAFRHIWATDWLKRHPDDFFTVSGKLNDTVGTVMKDYGHLRSSDHAARANRGNMGLGARAQANLEERTRRLGG